MMPPLQDHPKTPPPSPRTGRVSALALGTALCAGLSLMPPSGATALAMTPQPVAGSTNQDIIPPGPLSQADRDRLRARLRAMSAAELSLTYARIFQSFRELLTHQDLSAARTLVDYAVVTDAEMHRRRVARPPQTESPRGMLLLYELVL